MVDEEQNQNKNIKEVFDKAERIAVIGSPSSTNDITVDILGTAADKGLVGGLSLFNYNQDGKSHFALGQITEITMQNVWTQDPVMRGLIRQRGKIDPITERQDTHTAKMMIGSVFAENDGKFEQSSLGTVPSTGTSIKLLNEELMDTLLSEYKEHLFYLGKAYGTNIKMPMWLRHFGKEGFGAKEAYHLGIFGKTGSGKSVLAKMMITGYAKHEKMSIFILDPQGEFSRSFSEGSVEGKTIREKLGREIKIFNLHNLILDFSDELFWNLLISSGFFDRIALFRNSPEISQRFAAAFLKILGGKGSLQEEIKPWKFYERASFDRIWSQIPTKQFLENNIGTQPPRDRVKEAWGTLNADEIYNLWKKVMNLFKYDEKESVRISELFGKKEEEGSFVIIDLSSNTKSEELFWTEEIQLIAIQQFLSKIEKQAAEHFEKQGNLNSLVVIDEAHRLAPREDTDNGYIEKIKEMLVDSIRTTRKYGLGWMFISQTIYSLDKRIIDQLRTYIFGFGLAWGTERQALREIIGGAEDASKLYQSFKDPHSSLNNPEYPFMAMGPISPLSFSGSPLFFKSFKYPDQFLEMNKLK